MDTLLCFFQKDDGIGVLNEDNFEDTLKEIMGDGFSDWPKVETITIESGVTRIGDYAFAGLNYLSYFAKVFVTDSIEEMGQGLFDGRSTIDYYFYGTVPSFDKSFDDSLGEYANVVFYERNKTDWNSIIEKYGEVLIDEWQDEYTDLYKYEFYTSNTFESEEDMVRLNPSPLNIPINLEVLWQDYEKISREDSREKVTFVIEGGWYTESIEITSYNKAVVLKPALLEMIPGTYVVKKYQKPGNSLDVLYDTKVREIQAVIEETKPNKLAIAFKLNGNDMEIEEGCLDIGSFKNVVDGVHEHKYEETVVNPTCVEKGFRKYICSICGDEYTDNEQAAYGHQWKEVIDKPATTTSTGLKHEECTVCKVKRNENTVINKLPSSPTEEVPPTTEQIPPTTEQTPPVTENPSVDNNETITYPTKGTVLKDTKSKATFTVTEAGKTVAYTGTTNKKATSATIPKTVTKDGVTYKVTSIAKNAFKNNKKLKKVTIGSNVTSIGTSAFQNCTVLKTVKMGSKVTSVGTKAFYGCKKLTSLTIGKNVTTIGTSAFQNCTSLKKVTIPSKVKKIGAKAFYGCKKMTSITIKTTKLTTKNVGKQTFTKAGSSNYKKLTVKVPSKKLKTYKTLLRKKGLSKKAKVKK